MKKSLLLLFTLAVSLVAQSQINCDGNRYQASIFTEVNTQSNIVYGNNTSFANVAQNLNFDFYEPQGDVVAERPLLILAHGGSFIFGNKTDAYMVSMCTRLAKMGYAVASIQYRLGYNVFAADSVQIYNACLLAVQDMKAAVRFFRKSYTEGNPYKISNDYIFAGGVSAGAVAAVQMAYLDKVEEVPAVINLSALGGLEGASGNAGFSSKVAGVINLCGAVGRLAWIEGEDVPIVSMHGTTDNVVPYGTDFYYLVNNPIIKLNGSGSIHDYVAGSNMIEDLKTWPGVGHTPFIDNPAYMDSVLAFVPPFLAERIICNNLLANETLTPKTSFLAYPNPSSTTLNISNFPIDATSMIVTNITGQVIYQTNQYQGNIDVSAWSNGLYFLTINTKQGSQSVKFLKN